MLSVTRSNSRICLKPKLIEMENKACVILRKENLFNVPKKPTKTRRNQIYKIISLSTTRKKLRWNRHETTMKTCLGSLILQCQISPTSCHVFSVFTTGWPGAKWNISAEPRCLKLRKGNLLKTRAEINIKLLLHFRTIQHLDPEIENFWF